MTTTLNNSYLVKLSTKGGGGQNCPKLCPRGLYTTPKQGHRGGRFWRGKTISNHLRQMEKMSIWLFGLDKFWDYSEQFASEVWAEWETV